jgi:hypothetical protein
MPQNDAGMFALLHRRNWFESLEALQHSAHNHYLLLFTNYPFGRDFVNAAVADKIHVCRHT